MRRTSACKVIDGASHTKLARHSFCTRSNGLSICALLSAATKMHASGGLSSFGSLTFLPLLIVSKLTRCGYF